MENETWFEMSNIAPVDEAYKLNVPSDTLQASKSGLLPVKGIEDHSRTINNVLYQSDTGSEGSLVHDYTGNMREPAMHVQHPRQPIYTNGNSMLQSSQTPTDNFPLPQKWNQRNDFPAMLPPMPARRIAQSSMPCVWSYGAIECSNGIAPHHSSNFFHRLRQRDNLNHSQHSAPHPSNYMYQSQSQNQIRKRHSNDQQQNRRHSLYNQFMLRKDTRLQDHAATKPSRRVQLVQQGIWHSYTCMKSAASQLLLCQCHI